MRAVALGWVLGMLALGSAAGCFTSQTIEITAKVQPRKPMAVRRLVVILKVGGDGAWYRGVQSGMSKALLRCGVLPQVLLPSGDVVDPVASGMEKAEQISAEAVMTVAGKGATASFTNFSNSQRELLFELWMIERISREVTWMAMAKLTMTTMEDMGSKRAGEDFGKKVVAQLLDDGALARCRERAQ